MKMNNKFSKKQIIDALISSNREEKLVGYNLQNSKKRILNILNDKISTDSSDQKSKTTFYSKIKNMKSILTNKFTLRVKLITTTFSLITVGVFVYTMFFPIANLRPEQVLAERFNTLTGTSANNIKKEAFVAEQSFFNVSAANGIITRTGSNVGSATVLDSSVTNLMPSDSKIDVNVKSLCETMELTGPDFTKMDNSTKDSTSLPKSTTVTVSCNFKNGYKYITKDENGKILSYNLLNSKFRIEYQGGKYAVKINNNQSANDNINFGQISYEASLLGFVLNDNKSILKKVTENGIQYNVYKQDFSEIGIAFSQVDNTTTTLSKSNTDSNYNLIYINSKTGKLYKVEMYNGDKIITTQKLIESKELTDSEADSISQDYSELKTNIVDKTEPKGFDYKKFQTSINEFVKQYKILLPNDKEYKLGYIDDSKSRQYYNSDEYKKYLKEMEEFMSYMNDPEFNPYVKNFQLEAKSTNSVDLDTLNITKPSKSLENIDQNFPKASYSIVNDNNYLNVSIYDKYDNNTLVSYFFGINEEVKSNQKFLKVNGKDLNATYYTKTMKSDAPIKELCKEGDKCGTLIGTDITIQVLHLELNGMDYLINSTNTDDISKFDWTEITQQQIDSYQVDQPNIGIKPI